MSGYVYFIGCQDTGMELRVKIGYTSRSPLARLMDFQPGSPQELDVLSYIHGDMALERKLHETFAPVRLHNEWFLASGLFERFIYRMMREGLGAKAPTPTGIFEEALFEEVCDWAPDPRKPDEDWMWLDHSAETDIWEDHFSHIWAARLAAFRARQAIVE